jgi:RNA polymerase Rpb8
VSRYRCVSELYGADLVLDVNSDVYPLELAARYTMRVTQTLVADVAAQKEEYDSVRLSPFLSTETSCAEGF